jgi:hypothetical protein
MKIILNQQEKDILCFIQTKGKVPSEDVASQFGASSFDVMNTLMRERLIEKAAYKTKTSLYKIVYHNYLFTLTTSGIDMFNHIFNSENIELAFTD